MLSWSQIHDLNLFNQEDCLWDNQSECQRGFKAGSLNNDDFIDCLKQHINDVSHTCDPYQDNVWDFSPKFAPRNIKMSSAAVRTWRFIQARKQPSDYSEREREIQKEGEGKAEKGGEGRQGEGGGDLNFFFTLL